MKVKLTKKEMFINLVKRGNPGTEAYNEMENICISRPDDVPFAQWVKQTDWTMGAIIAFFRYQCLYLNGDLDWEEFEMEFEIFKHKIYPVIELVA